MSLNFTVCYPIGFYYPAEGGPNNSVYWIAKALTNKGISVFSVSMDKDIPATIKRDLWHKTNYGTAMYVRSSNYILGLRYVVKSLQFKKQQNIILHLTSIFAPTSIVIGLLYRILYPKVNLIWSVRGELDPGALVYKTYLKKLFISIHQIFFASKVIYHATCNEEVSYIKSVIQPSSEIFMIPNLIDLPELKTVQKQQTIVYLGRIHPKKAIENLIEAFTFIKKKSNNLKLIIAGDANNDYGKLLTKRVNDLKLESQVCFIGHIEGPEKQQLLAEAKALILPSHTENFGNVVVEALAQKTPVIASKGTPWEILEQRNAGYWVENSPTELARAIDQLLELDQPAYQQMCDNALELVSTEFEVNRNIGKWINAYQMVLDNEAH